MKAYVTVRLLRIEMNEFEGNREVDCLIAESTKGRRDGALSDWMPRVRVWNTAVVDGTIHVQLH